MNKQIFNSIDQGPLWVFTADHRMSDVEVSTLSSNLDHFISLWDAHGRPVHATFEIIDNTVVIIAADGQKSDVTGCSKDKLTHFFRDLGKVISVDFFNRMLVPVIDGDSIKLVHWNEVEDVVKQGSISEIQQYIDATVASVEEFKKKGFATIAELLVAQA